MQCDLRCNPRSYSVGFVCACTYMHVCMFMCGCVYLCPRVREHTPAYVCGKARGQSCLLFFRCYFLNQGLTCLELTEQARLAHLGAPEVCLSLLPQFLDYKCLLLPCLLSPSVNSSPCSELYPLAISLSPVFRMLTHSFASFF